MNDEPERNRRNGDGKIQWQVIAGILSFLMAFGAFAGTYYVNSYRLDEIEKKVEKLEAKIDHMDERTARLQATYDLLIDQAREHGWTIPWQPRRGR